MGRPGNGEAPKIVWVKEGNVISPVEVVTGYTSGDRTGIEGNLTEGQEVVTGFTSESPQKTETVERSPFAPGPPGRGGNSGKNR